MTGAAAAVPDRHPGRQPAHRRGAIRIGASLMDPRTGELTALGIVEVPEGMPLSEGATRARQARRLLQRVMDYVPEGTVIHPLVRIGRHAAAGIVEAAAEQEADLMIFGWGGKSGPHRDPDASVISPTIDEVVRESPCDIAVVKQRGARDIRRILVPVRGGPHAESPCGSRTPSRSDGATVVVMHLVPAGVTQAVRAQAEAHWPRTPPVRDRPLRAAAARDGQRPDGDPARGRARRPRGHGRLGAARRRRRVVVRRPRGAIAQRAKPTVIVVKTREPIGRQTFEQLAEARRDAGRRGPRGRGVARDPGQG